MGISKLVPAHVRTYVCVRAQTFSAICCSASHTLIDSHLIVLYRVRVLQHCTIAYPFLPLLIIIAVSYVFVCVLFLLFLLG